MMDRKYDDGSLPFIVCAIDDLRVMTASLNGSLTGSNSMYDDNLQLTMVSESGTSLVSLSKVLVVEKLQIADYLATQEENNHDSDENSNDSS